MENLNSLSKPTFIFFAAIVSALLTLTASASPVALESWDDVITAVEQANLDGGNCRNPVYGSHTDTCGLHFKY